MKPKHLLFLLLGWVWILPEASLSADERHLNEGEVLVDIRYPTRTVRMILVGLEEGELTLRTVAADRGERAYLSVRELARQGTVIQFAENADYQRALRLARRGDHAEARSLYRRSVTPMLRYLRMGEVAGNLITIVDAWIETAIALEEWNEAIDLIDRIDLRIAPRQTFGRVISLAQTLFEKELWSTLRNLEGKILRIENPNAMQRTELLRLGHFWRENQLYAEASRLYERVTGFEGDASREAHLWRLYASLFMEGADPASVEESFEARPAHRQFSLELLIQAKMATLREDSDGAMRLAAEAFAYSGPEETHHPEIMTILGHLYLGREEEAIAAQIFRQGQLLYPDTVWEKRFNQSFQTVLPESPL